MEDEAALRGCCLFGPDFRVFAAAALEVDARLLRGMLIVAFDEDGLEDEAAARDVLLRVVRRRLAGGGLEDVDGCCSSSSSSESGSGAARFLPLRSGTGSLIVIAADTDALERRVVLRKVQSVSRRPERLIAQVKSAHRVAGFADDSACWRMRVLARVLGPSPEAVCCCWAATARARALDLVVTVVGVGAGTGGGAGS